MECSLVPTKFNFTVQNVTCKPVQDIPYMDCVQMEKEIMVLDYKCKPHPRLECEQKQECVDVSILQGLSQWTVIL